MRAHSVSSRDPLSKVRQAPGIQVHEKKCEISRGVAITEAVIELNAIIEHDLIQDYDVVQMEITMTVANKAAADSFPEEIRVDFEKVKG